MSVVAWICHGALNNVLHSRVAIACKLVNNSLAEGLISTLMILVSPEKSK